MSFCNKVKIPHEKDMNSANSKQSNDRSDLNYKSIIQRVTMEPQPMSHDGGMVAEECSSRHSVGIGIRELGLINNHSQSIQKKKENKTGLPDNLRTGIENLSGLSMEGVRVHYNSDKPAKVGALAYTQGKDIHVAPGQQQHVPHEAWHVVQQAEGRVRPTMQMKGVNINDDVRLEKEADDFGKRALRNNGTHEKINNVGDTTSNESMLQCKRTLNLTKPNYLRSPIQMQRVNNKTAKQVINRYYNACCRGAFPAGATLQGGEVRTNRRGETYRVYNCGLSLEPGEDYVWSDQRGEIARWWKGYPNCWVEQSGYDNLQTDVEAPAGADAQVWRFNFHLHYQKQPKQQPQK